MTTKCLNCGNNYMKAKKEVCCGKYRTITCCDNPTLNKEENKTKEVEK